MIDAEFPEPKSGLHWIMLLEMELEDVVAKVPNGRHLKQPPLPHFQAGENASPIAIVAVEVFHANVWPRLHTLQR